MIPLFPILLGKEGIAHVMQEKISNFLCKVFIKGELLKLAKARISLSGVSSRIFALFILVSDIYFTINCRHLVSV